MKHFQLKNSLLLTSLMLATFALSGCGSDSSGSGDNTPPVTAAKDTDRDGVADIEDAELQNAEVSAKSVSEYFDDDGNLIGTGTYEIRGDGKITAEESVYVAGSDQTSFRAEITYTDSGEVASITINDNLDETVDFTVTNTYDEADRLIRRVSVGVDKFDLPNNPLNTQAPIARVYNNPLIAGIRVLRRAGTVEIAYNASGSVTSQQTDYGSDNSIEISESAIYDSAERKISTFYSQDDDLTLTRGEGEIAYVYAGDNELPISELYVISGFFAYKLDYVLDNTGRITSRATSIALANYDEVTPEQMQSDAAGSTALSQQMLKNSYAAEYVGLSGGTNYFDLLYRSTYMTGLPDSGSLVLETTAQTSTRYDQFGNTTDILKRPSLSYWVVSTNDPQGHLINLGADRNQDGQIDYFDVKNNYNTQGFLTRSERDFELIDGELIPQQLRKISYGAYGPIYGSLSIDGNSLVAASFAISYDTYGVITDYRLRSGDLANYGPYASISHRYVGSSQIDPAKLNLLILGLSQEQSFDSLFSPIFPPIGGLVIGDPVSGGSLGLTPVEGETVVENPDPPVIVVTGVNDVCFGGLRFC